MHDDCFGGERGCSPLTRAPERLALIISYGGQNFPECWSPHIRVHRQYLLDTSEVANATRLARTQAGIWLGGRVIAAGATGARHRAGRTRFRWTGRSSGSCLGSPCTQRLWIGPVRSLTNCRTRRAFSSNRLNCRCRRHPTRTHQPHRSRSHPCRTAAGQAVRKGLQRHQTDGQRLRGVHHPSLGV